jgi:hypothetical protein
MDDLSGIIKIKSKHIRDGMEAMREIQVIKGNALTRILPESVAKAPTEYDFCYVLLGVTKCA